MNVKNRGIINAVSKIKWWYTIDLGNDIVTPKMIFKRVN